MLTSIFYEKKNFSTLELDENAKSSLKIQESTFHNTLISLNRSPVCYTLEMFDSKCTKNFVF